MASQAFKTKAAAFLAKTKAKLNGARKSVTVFVIACWQGIIHNLDYIQTQMPMIKQFMGDHAMQIFSGIFAAILLYVRIFHTKGRIEDKGQNNG